MIEQAFAGRGQFHAAPAALEQHDAKRKLEPLDALGGRRQRKMHPPRARSDAAGLRDRDEELQIDQIKTHGTLPCYLPSTWPKAFSVRSRLCRLVRSVNVILCRIPIPFS